MFLPEKIDQKHQVFLLVGIDWFLFQVQLTWTHLASPDTNNLIILYQLIFTVQLNPNPMAIGDLRSKPAFSDFELISNDWFP